MVRARRLARLLGRYRDCQARAAFRAAPLEHLASARRGHPRQESMGWFASAVVRLVGPVHYSWVAAKKTFTRVCIQTDSICCRSGLFGSGSIFLDGLLFRSTPNTQSNHTARH